MSCHIRYLIIMPAMMVIHSNCQTEHPDPMGTFGYDKAFLKNQQIDFIELKEDDGPARLLIVPAWQGRVMTSSAGGDRGTSFGWINHSFIESGTQDPQINV